MSHTPAFEICTQRLGVSADATDLDIALAVCEDTGIALLGPAGTAVAIAVVRAVRVAERAGSLAGVADDEWVTVLTNLATAAVPDDRDRLVISAVSLAVTNGLTVADLDDVTGPIDVDVAAWRWCVCLAYYAADRLVTHLGYRAITA